MTDQKQRENALSHFVHLARGVIPPMHPAGLPFVLGAAIGTLLIRAVSRRGGVIGALLTAWMAWFFRQPHRTAPSRSGVALAPADGTVSQVGLAALPPELGFSAEPMLRVNVFLPVFDVHVQQIPVTGEVRQIAYRKGKFLSADLDKASDFNERNTILLRSTDGHDIAVTQIAGLVARRIVCDIAEDAPVLAGQTYGLIRFGSRVDLYLPPSSRVLVEPGQRAIGGETVLAELPEGAAIIG